MMIVAAGVCSACLDVPYLENVYMAVIATRSKKLIVGRDGQGLDGLAVPGIVFRL
jgi:hypothetical protein